jgi:hypothetical protein
MLLILIISVSVNNVWIPCKFVLTTLVIDGYDNEKGGGFRRPLAKSDSITYIRKLSREARRYGMSIGLKNSADILKSVDDDVHFAGNTNSF